MLTNAGRYEILSYIKKKNPRVTNAKRYFIICFVFILKDSQIVMLLQIVKTVIKNDNFSILYDFVFISLFIILTFCPLHC